MKLKLEYIFTLILAAAITVGIIFTRSSQSHLGGNFSIPSTKGDYQLKQDLGKVVVLYFGFRYCPDICPTMLSSLAAAYKKLNVFEQNKVSIIFISVDSKRDNISGLKEYIEFFHSDFTAAVTSEAKTKKLARKYGINYIINPPKGDEPNNYTVDHFPNALILNHHGIISDTIDHNATIKEILEKLKTYIKDIQ